MNLPFCIAGRAASLPMLCRKLASLVLAGTAAWGMAAAQAATWSIVDLGTLGGGESVAVSVNESGQVLGYSETSGGAVHAFLYRNGAIRDLSDSQIAVNFALAINNRGQAVGYYASAGGGRDFPVLFANGAVVRLGQTSGRARGVNNAGTIVGDALIGPQGQDRAFMFRRGAMADLGTLGGSSSVATAINNSGVAVGGSATAGDNTSHAFLYGRQGMIDLGTLGGSFSLAYAINERQDVVGESTVADGSSHAFLLRQQKMQDLGTLGGNFSRALGINNSGQVVGFSTNASDPGIRAFLYSDGTMIDLNSLPAVQSAGWFLASANGINGAGQIVGAGIVNGQNHGFLLSPSNATARHQHHQPDEGHDESEDD